MSSSPTFTRLQNLLVRFGAHGPVTPDSDFASLGFDELDELEIMMAVTEEFGPNLDDFEPRNVGHLVETLEAAPPASVPDRLDALPDVARQEKEQAQVEQQYARLLDILVSDYPVVVPPGPTVDLTEFLGIGPSDTAFKNALQNEFRIRLPDDFTIGTVTDVLLQLRVCTEPFTPDDGIVVPQGLVKSTVLRRLVDIAGTEVGLGDGPEALNLSEGRWTAFLRETADALGADLPPGRAPVRTVGEAVSAFMFESQLRTA
ncbi:MAG: hypothetical protein AAF645_05450 [Myxococcota bacterium]